MSEEKVTNVELLQERINELTQQLEEKEKAFNTALSMAYFTGWLAFCWNDHNFLDHPQEYAIKTMKKLGLNTLEEGNEFLNGLKPGTGMKLELPIPIPMLPKGFVALPTAVCDLNKGPAYEDGRWSTDNWEAILEDNPQVVTDTFKGLEKEQIDAVLIKHKLMVKDISDVTYNVRSVIDEIIKLTLLNLNNN
jgi:hypothetical protein